MFKLLLWEHAYNLVQKDPHLGLVLIAKNTEHEPLFIGIGISISINNPKYAKQCFLKL